jgi:hypothetical protein
MRLGAQRFHCSCLFQLWRNTFSRLPAAFVALAALGLAAPPASAQSPAASPGASTSTAPAPGAGSHSEAPASRAERPPAGGMHEGIKVHGWWTIEVRNPKGKLLSHTEFENQLTSGGQLALALLLSGYATGDWMVTLDGGGIVESAPASPEPVCTNSIDTSGVGPCGIPEAGGYFAKQDCPGSGLQCFPTLTVANPANGSSAHMVTLQGNATAAQGGKITDVETLLTVCSASVTPTACQTGNPYTNVTFTVASLPASSTASTPCGGYGQISCAVSVPEAGDTINVTVQISFQ